MGMMPFNPVAGMKYTYRDGTPVASCAEGARGYLPHASTRFVNWERTEALPAAIAGRELPELYDSREECCGCGACRFACAAGAIAMLPDEEGFLYPVVDAALCVRCGRCLKACVFKGGD